MNQDEMFEHMRSGMRTGADALEALEITLSVCDCEMLLGNGKDLFVRCDNMPPDSIITIDFLTRANFLKWQITAFTIKEVPIPYLHIYKK